MYNRPFTKEIEKQARLELNEIASRRDEEIERLREWLKQQPHLNSRTDYLWLLNFLRGTKFNFNAAQEKLNKYYAIRAIIPELYANRDPLSPDIQNVLSQCIFIPFQTPEKDVLLVRWHDSDNQKSTISDVIRVGLMIVDILIYESKTSGIVGFYFIEDFSNLPIGYMKSVPIMLMADVMRYVPKAIPFRLKQVYFINIPTTVDLIYNNVLKPLISKKLTKRVITYKSEETNELFNVIPSAFLPKEYGGKGESVYEIADYWKRKVESYRQWFLDDQQYRSYDVDLKIFQENLEKNELEGTFRRLKID